MDDATLIYSGKGKIQLSHLGFTLCVNKPTKNNNTYFRCIERDTSAKCKATASISGPLEPGEFNLVFHHASKHTHEPSPVDKLVRQFLEELRISVSKRVDVSVQKLFEELKLTYASKLSPEIKTLFLKNIPSQKNCLMRGYRSRACHYEALPKTLEEVVIPESFQSTLDGLPLYQGRTEDHCHLFMSPEQCRLLRSKKSQSIFYEKTTVSL